MKRLLALILCTLILLSISGCGNKAEESFKTAKIVAKSDPYRVYAPNEKNIVLDNTENISYVNNMVMIVFKEGTSDEEIIETVKSVNGKVLETVPSINQYQIEIPEKTLNELFEIIKKLEERDSVLFAHYDEVTINAEDSYTPTDPWDNDVNEEDWTDEDIDGSNWWMELTNVYGAWQYDHYFSEIKIGILDTGFDTEHPDLSLSFPDNLAENNKKDDHGTHVAGIIGAKHNDIGISGIVKRADLICVDCVSDTFRQKWNTDTMLYIGLTELVESGAKVINVSMGKSKENTFYSYSALSEEAKKASGYMARLLEDHDFIVVQSAGNSNVYARYNGLFASVTEESSVTFGEGRANVQGILKRIIVVGNIETQYSKSGTYFRNSTSNHGTQVDIAAPGGTYRLDENGNQYTDANLGVFSTVSDNCYMALGGTSMSAPMVTSVCALVWSTSDLFTGEEVADIVISTAEGKVLQDSSATYGILNAEAATEKAVSIIDKTEEIIEKEEEANINTTPSVDYEIVRMDKSAIDEEGNSTENYYYEYLVIKNEGKIYEKLNERFLKKAEEFLNGSDGEKIASYGYGNSGYSIAWTKVTHNKGGILGITVSSDSYLGGNTSHGSFSHYYFDLKTGEEATIEALLGMDRETILNKFREISLEGLNSQIGGALFPGVDERVKNMSLEEFKYSIRDSRVYIEFEQYSVTDGTWGDIVIVTDLYIVGAEKE